MIIWKFLRHRGMLFDRRQEQDVKLQNLRKEGEKLDARKKEFEEEERKPLPEPKYPQPPVVQTEVVSNRILCP